MSDSGRGASSGDFSLNDSSSSDSSAPIILASASAQRKIMMATLGLAFTIEPAAIDEKKVAMQVKSGRFDDRVMAVAAAKAKVVATKFPEAVVIAADSMVVVNQDIYEKPEDLDSARRMLQAQSGSWVDGYTGVALISPDSSQSENVVSQSRALFRELQAVEIENYIQNNPVLDWAGAFSPAYHAGAGLFSQLEGSLTGFSYGFPIEIIAGWLKKIGVIKLPQPI